MTAAEAMGIWFILGGCTVITAVTVTYWWIKR